MRSACWFVVVLALLSLPSTARAQGGGLTEDLIDGETLYKGGWLFTLAYQLQVKEGLRDADASTPDPLDQRRKDHSVSLAAHYGLRQDLQLTLVVPAFVYKELRLRDPNGPDRFDSEGIGDVSAFVKWRFLRLDIPHQGANFSVIAGLETPTGQADQEDEGIRLPPGLQPGSGSWDPILGLAVSYEPYRWKFTASARYVTHTEGRGKYRFGDRVSFKTSVGNRVWVEKYPGPSLRLELIARFEYKHHDYKRGHRVRNTGGETYSVAFNAAFHPVPEIDIVVEVEVPVYKRFRGTQLETDVVLAFLFGYRF